MGLVPWGSDYLSASIMLDPTFSCAARGDTRLDNFSHLCDAGLKAAIGRARAAAPEDVPAAWAAVDHRVVNLAAAVP